jgi:predicted  nucleic acid-binding Zn-ribbon protein
VPDTHRFDHLRDWGRMFHRCIDCGWPGYGQTVSERDRERHAREHQRDRARDTDRRRRANLADARRAQRQIDRENRIAYGGTT